MPTSITSTDPEHKSQLGDSDPERGKPLYRAILTLFSSGAQPPCPRSTGFQNAAGDPPARIARRVADIVVGTGMNNHGRSIRVQ